MPRAISIGAFLAPPAYPRWVSKSTSAYRHDLLAELTQETGLKSLRVDGGIDGRRRSKPQPLLPPFPPRTANENINRCQCGVHGAKTLSIQTEKAVGGILDRDSSRARKDLGRSDGTETSAKTPNADRVEFPLLGSSRGPVFSRTQLRRSDFLRRHYGDATGVLEQADRPGIVTHHELRGLHVDGVGAARRSRGARRRQADSHHVIVERVKRGAGRARGVRVRQGTSRGRGAA